MSTEAKNIWQHKAINGWNLVWLISIPMSIVIVREMLQTGLSSGEEISHMIGYAVRFAVPILYVVVVAAALPVLFPGAFSTWCLRNRKYIGFGFAVAMAWQGAFIFMMSNYFREYYFEDIYLFRNELEGSTGYIFLAAMVVTSFQLGRKHLNPNQWKLLHRSAIYFLWAYAFSVYWWAVSGYYGTAPQMYHYVFYVGGFLAFALRIAAWGKKRLQKLKNEMPESSIPMTSRMLGGTMVVLGLLLSVTAHQWQAPVSAFLTTPAWSATLESWLPYWPFEPWIALFLIGVGTYFLSTPKANMLSQRLSGQPASELG